MKLLKAVLWDIVITEAAVLINRQVNGQVEERVRWQVSVQVYWPVNGQVNGQVSVQVYWQVGDEIEGELK